MVFVALVANIFNFNPRMPLSPLGTQETTSILFLGCTAPSLVVMENFKLYNTTLGSS